jgi:hypothetical protein
MHFFIKNQIQTQLLILNKLIITKTYQAFLVNRTVQSTVNVCSFLVIGFFFFVFLFLIIFFLFDLVR